MSKKEDAAWMRPSSSLHSLFLLHHSPTKVSRSESLPSLGISAGNELLIRFLRAPILFNEGEGIDSSVPSDRGVRSCVKD